ncbi:MAG: HD domain-containing protein [Candidatus Hodarchaeales archaeon]|jgi:5'-deoxynucleotidase YfbR-like HD superfamily hydrolase
MTNFDHYWGISKLKQLLRQGWINNVPVSGIESVADHSFAVAYFSYIFSLWENELRQENNQPLLKKEPQDYCVIGLMHDIAESYYLDLDKNVIDLIPEIKNLKKTAEERGFKKINEFWSNKSEKISKNLDDKFSDALDDESRIFIELIDKLELHWQTITYYKQNWISLLNAEPFLISTFDFLIKNSENFLFINELLKEQLLIEDLRKSF